MQIDTRYAPLKVTNATNVTGASITDPSPTTTPPTGDGIIDMGITTKSAGVIQLGGTLANSLLIVPFAVATSTGQSFTMNAYAWNLTVPGQLSPSGLWVPITLATFTCSVGNSNSAGVAGSDIGSTNFFCNAITLSVGNANVSVEIVSPGAGALTEIAHIILDAKGAGLVELRFAKGTTTSANAAVKVL